MWFTYCSLLKDFPLWPTFPDLDIFHPVYLNSYTSVFSSHSLWPFWALGFVLSPPMGQDTLVNFHCFQLCMSKLTCWISHDSLMDLKIAILKTSLLSQQHVMMSKCHMICTNYITHVTSIMESWYNLPQNRLKSNRFYTTYITILPSINYFSWLFYPVFSFL